MARLRFCSETEPRLSEKVIYSSDIKFPWFESTKFFNKCKFLKMMWIIDVFFNPLVFDHFQDVHIVPARQFEQKGNPWIHIYKVELCIHFI